ncbi:MAG: TonB-dependent receptor [Chitinophagaceae bacterium]|jgi:vitamin B12 transporter|nr:TonB-dependent receptor [Chitinophagaceae bacterium]
MKKKMFFVTAVLISSYAQVQAQIKPAGLAEDTTVKQLNEVVITATRSEKKVKETARSVTVFTAADIQKLPYQNLGDLLSRSEGIYIPGALQTPGSLQTFGMRGANSNQTLIMIDGIKISDATSPDNVLDFSELSLANIERIEIVRGSHSTLYGSSAIGGVINIITKQNGKQGFNGNISSRFGTFGKKTSDFTNQAFFNYTDKSGIYANAEVLDTRVKGLNAIIDTNSNQSVKLNEQDDFFKTDIVGKLGFRNKKTDAYISYRNAFQQSDIDDGAYMDDNNRIIRIKRDLITYGAQYNFNNSSSLKYIGGYSNMFRRDKDDSTIRGGVNDYTFTSGKYSGRNWNNELQYNWKNKTWNIVGGVGVVKEQMTLETFVYYNSPFFSFQSNGKIDSVNSNTKFVYVHTEWKQTLGESLLSIGVGGRLNDHSRFGNYATLELTPSFRITEKVMLYGAVTSAYNAPSLYQLFAPNKDFASGITRGNDGLQPETSLSMELGMKLSPNKNLFITVSGFRTRVNNAIEYVYLWNGSKPVNSLTYLDAYGDTYLNIGTNTVLGAEVSFNAILSRHFTISGNASLLTGELDYSNSDIDKAKTKSNHVQLYSNGSFLTADVNVNKLVRRPSTANLSLSYKLLDQLRITADYRFVGGRQDVFYDSKLGPYGALGRSGLDNYSLVNLSANWQALKQVLLQLQLNNLLDEEYMEIAGYTTRRRGFVLNARFTF